MKQSEPVAKLEIASGGSVQMSFPYPHCGKLLRMTGEHPPTKIELFKVEERAE